MSAKFTAFCGLLVVLAMAEPGRTEGLVFKPILNRAQIRTEPLASVTINTHTELKVCAHAAGCPPGVPGWLETAGMEPGSRDVPREFWWKTGAAGVSHGRWEVSLAPFPSGADASGQLLASGDAGAPQPGKFNIRFLDLPAAPTVKSGGLFRLKRNAVGAVLPSRYYIHVVPMIGNRPAGSASNAVEVSIGHAGQTAPNPLVMLPHDVYKVEILHFEPVRSQSLPWGCVIVTGVDKSAFKGFYAAAYDYYAKAMASGQPICPAVYKGMGEPAWYESLWDFSSSGVNWASKLYADLKTLAVKAVASAINALPGNLCNPDCEKGLMAGLNAGLVALGVPPNLPNLDELTNQGMNYLVEEAVAQAGIDCDAQCQNSIRSGIQDMAREAGDRTVTSYCGDVELAHSNGREPLCLPPGVSAKPAPGSANQPANTLVRITRKPGTGNVAASILASYRLALDFPAVNPAGIGYAWGVATNTCYTDTSVFPCDVEIIKTTAALQGALFRSVNAPLPPLKPGQSIEVPFFLEPTAYWLPGHQERIREKGGHVKYNDWWKLYQGARLTVKADILCPHTTGAAMDSCVTPASLAYTIPGVSN